MMIGNNLSDEQLEQVIGGINQQCSYEIGRIDVMHIDTDGANSSPKIGVSKTPSEEKLELGYGRVF